jgi:hypothetical protein
MDESSKPQENLYKLSLLGEGVAIEKQVSLNQALQIVQIAMTGDNSKLGSVFSAGTVRSPKSRQSNSSVSGGRETVGEFIQRVEASRNPDVITAMAFFMRQQDGMDVFTKDDIKSRFRFARIPLPKNFSRDFNIAIEGAWIAEDQEDPNLFYITQTGENAVEAGFAMDIRGRTVRKSRAPGSETKSKTRNGTKKNSVSKTRSNPTLLKDLDLGATDGNPSLEEFYDAHKVNADLKRNVVFAHYLHEIKGIDTVTESHILTCYHDLKLALPVSMESSLKNSNATSRGGYLMSSNPKDVKLSMQGRNLILELERKNKAA